MAAWAARAEQEGASPGAVLDLPEMNLAVDARAILPAVAVPTVVLHSRRDPLFPIENARYLAARIPGARFASALADRQPDRVAALAALGGLRAPSGDGEPVPVLAVHGTRDPINPYPGGGKAYWGYGVDRALAGWVARNRCSAENPATTATASVHRLEWKRCAGGSEVTLYRFDAGHVWPGSALPLPVERFGPTPRGFDATAAIVELFERHELR